MAVTTVDRYGAPSYGAIGKPPAGIVFHTPEFGTTPALKSAIDCAAWQATSGNTSGGSYHGLLGHDDVKFPHGPKGCTVADHWTMVRSVPWNQAAGGLSGNHTPPSQGGSWDPGRYPWLAQLLGAAAYADPNRWLHQISLGGKTAWYLTNGYPQGMLRRLAEWIIILEKAYGYDAVLSLHRHWQTNRTDPGALDFADKVLVEYAKLKAPAPAPAPTPTPVPTYTQAQLDAAVNAAKSSARAGGIKDAAAAAAAVK